MNIPQQYPRSSTVPRGGTANCRNARNSTFQTFSQYGAVAVKRHSYFRAEIFQRFHPQPFRKCQLILFRRCVLPTPR